MSPVRPLLIGAGAIGPTRIGHAPAALLSVPEGLSVSCNVSDFS